MFLYVTNDLGVEWVVNSSIPNAQDEEQPYTSVLYETDDISDLEHWLLKSNGDPSDIRTDETDDTGGAIVTLITADDFRGTGLGAGRITDLAEDGITTVEQLVELGQDGIDELSGISSKNAVKIFDRAVELVGA